jgi:hypothetical protein
MSEYAITLSEKIPAMKTHELINGWNPDWLGAFPYIITNPRWTETKDVLEFDLFDELGYISTNRVNYILFYEAILDKSQLNFEIKKTRNTGQKFGK